MTDPAQRTEDAHANRSRSELATAQPNIRDALALAAAQLIPVSESPRLDAELLMAEALGIDRGELLLRDLRAATPSAFEALVERRLAHEPVAYILGRRAFWTIEIEVGPGVLVPRPDSETLIEAAVAHFADRPPETVLDLGSGPGTLLLAALDQWPQARGLGIERSEAALAFAERNARRLGFCDRASFQLGDWASDLDGRFDLILCNPPYIAEDASLPADVAIWEPRSALFAGREGLDDFRRLAPMLPSLLGPRGIACVEIGYGQEAAVSGVFAAQGFTISSRPDLNAVARCLILSFDRG